jgi:hypothetical protein
MESDVEPFKLERRMEYEYIELAHFLTHLNNFPADGSLTGLNDKGTKMHSLMHIPCRLTQTL